MSRTLLPGKPYPLGSTAHRKGTNFALFSEGAERVDVCFYDADGNETDCVDAERADSVCLARIHPGHQARPALRYRVHGPWEPEEGTAFNPAKSAGRSVCESDLGPGGLEGPHFPYDVASGDLLKIDTQDSAAACRSLS